MRTIIFIVAYFCIGLLWDEIHIWLRFKGNITLYEYYVKNLRLDWFRLGVDIDPETVMNRSLILTLMFIDTLIWPINIIGTIIMKLYYIILLIRD